MTHKMNVMSPKHGHSVLEWNPVDDMSTEVVREKFEELVSAGYLPFSGGTLLTEFDETVDEITMSPLVVAG